MKIFFAASVVLIALTTAIFAQQPAASRSSDEIQIKQLELAWEQAESRQDVKAIAAIVAESLSYVDYDGSAMNKAEYLRSVTASKLEPDHFYNEGVTVKVFGDAAIATGIFRETGTTKGKAYVNRARYTDTWIKQDSVWRCIASQSTLIRGK